MRRLLPLWLTLQPASESIALLIVLLALLIAPSPAMAGSHWQAPPRPQGSHWQNPVKGSHWQRFTPEVPLHRGLSLLSTTPRHDYGNLTPYKVSATQTITLPASVNLISDTVPVGDQAYIGSCAAWATTYSLAGWWATKEGLPVTEFAPMYAYHQSNGGADNGSYPVDNILADMRGLLPMSVYTQGNYDWSTPPSGTEMALAPQITAVGGYTSYQKMSAGDYYGDSGPYAAPTQGELMDSVRYPLEYALSHLGPQVLSLAVMPSFDNATPQTAYVYDDPNPLDVLGYHAVLAVGYDRSGVWIENQWGTGWGLNGFAELSWDYVLDQVSEADGIKGVTETKSVALHVTTGIPTIATQVVTDGIPLSTTVLTAGHEVVLRGTGFRPGENVFLSIDGSYRQYVPVMEDGTWSTELYDHPETKREGPHNHLWTPGAHHLSVRGASGDWAWTTLVTD